MEISYCYFLKKNKNHTDETETLSFRTRRKVNRQI